MKRKQGVEMAKILIVEDEKSINDLILMNLSLELNHLSTFQ